MTPASGSAVEITARAPSDELARQCLRAYEAELQQRFGVVFDGGGGNDRLEPPRGLFLVAVLAEQAVGCGGVRFECDATAEIKRLWVSPDARGHGVGRRLLGLLEDAARERGAGLVRLDTNETLTEAMSLYRSAGYVEVARYNDNPHAHHWFEKRLSGVTR